ncbi:MAG: HAMP domain-containing protein [Candidatus Rokubacteria bacterium]|nr:HAMP domain-containing protein [Candidatus Rokubacteria bacterium]
MTPLRPWQRLSVRLAALFVAVTLIGVGLVGGLIYEHQKRDLEETLGEVLLNIARTGVLLVDPAFHAEVARTRRMDSEPYRRIRAALAAVQDENRLDTPIYTLTDFDAAKRQARFMVTSRGPGAPGEPYSLVPELIEPLGRAFREGVAAYTPIYHNQSGTWITAFAPIKDTAGRTVAVLDVDYRVSVYVRRLAQVRTTVLQASIAGALLALVVGVLLARRITRPVSALTGGVARVAAGDLSETLPVPSSDEVGRLTEAFNAMLDGLRQRDYIRDTFGRYVSPEVAHTLLESPDALRLGGEKREVTILMSDLRGYTRFAERGDPQQVTAVLNEYLARMTDIITAHGGTINEFIGDAIFAVFGAPIAHPDHAARAAGAALAMQRAMAEVNAANAARALPRFEMGIGVNTGEAVVGNIGSAQRAKYAVVGNAVNVAARVESATVGGQVFVSAAMLERVRDLAEVGAPVPVEVKGIAEPLVLYELRGIAGRFAQRLPEMATEGDPQVDVALPLTCRVIEGKVVGEERVSGTVRRLGTRRLDVRLDAPLPQLTNVRLRLNYPGLGYDSGDLYGKIVGEAQRDGERLTQIRLTSVDPVDQKILEDFLAG